MHLPVIGYVANASMFSFNFN